MGFCCENCFKNKHIKSYIRNHYEKIGECDYCETGNFRLISLRKVGEYLESCIFKKYEYLDDGSGAMYDSEKGEYVIFEGDKVTIYSIRDILIYEEDIFDERAQNSMLPEDIFKELHTEKDIQEGDFCPQRDIDSECFVIRNGLYGMESTAAFTDWQIFKHTIKHYSRFFDIAENNSRMELLDKIGSYLNCYDEEICIGRKFIRTRRSDASIANINKIDVWKEMGPAPYKYAKTNRMSPAGISYLYLADDIDTAIAECRLEFGYVLATEYEAIRKMHILNFSKPVCYKGKNLFEEQYDNDELWISSFMEEFIKELSEPVDENTADHSYEYTATQVLAEYFRSKKYDGICFKSSVSNGNSYVFFYGPDTNHTPDAYPYPFGDMYMMYDLPILEAYTDYFKINKVVYGEVKNKGYITIKERRIKNRAH